MRDVVLVAPAHRRSGLDRQARRRKGEIVDLHRRVLGARAAGKEKGRRNECGDQENGAEGAGTPFGT